MTTAPARTDWPQRLCVLLIWAVCAGVLLWVSYKFILRMNFRDADDALRLAEVRDWMAGQSWFDVSQYRINPPQGVPMHWSRLVDVPLATFIWLFSLFTDRFTAERLTGAILPLLQFLALFLTVDTLTRRVTGQRWLGVVAAAMLATSVGVIIQYQPMRIDHHSWQILLNTLAVLMLIDAVEGCASRAAAAGALMALSLTVALESMPLAITMAGLLAFAWLRNPARAPALAAFLEALTGGGAILLLATLGWPRLATPWCDSLSPAYLLPIAVATGLVLAGLWLPVVRTSLTMRLGLLALAGLAAAILFAVATPQCVAGPFAHLDPLVRRLWFDTIGEGMPVWTQAPDVAMLIPLQGLLGLVGTLLALRFDPVERRGAWATLLVLQLLTFAVSMTVMRAMGLAHTLALPGCAWLFIAAMRRARRQPSTLTRVGLGALCVLLTPVGAEAVALTLIDAPQDSHRKEAWDARFGCTTLAQLHGLQAIPPTVLFAPLDIGPHLLAYTRHSVMATGHHRGSAAMHTVISAFVASPEAARPIVLSTPARYLVLCRGENEVRKYIRYNRHSLMAMLNRDRAPAWLQRVPMRRGESIRVYRIVRD